MSENTVTITLSKDDKTATALIRHERSTSKIRYAEYVSDHAVTLETVPAHVQGLANLAGSIRKWDSAAERKAFCTKVRNGLKHHLAPAASDDDEDKVEVDLLAAVVAAATKAVEAGLRKADVVAAVRGI
jgi:hypothetical protein